jgi:hypothetical protein
MARSGTRRGIGERVRISRPPLARVSSWALCGSVLGDLFGWVNQQGGRFVHDVLPIRGHEDQQINSSSRSDLLWHTEDAFHSARADYVGLLCLRNPQETPTTIASVGDISLRRSDIDILMQPRFALKPDSPHFDLDVKTNASAPGRRGGAVREPIDIPKVPCSSVIRRRPTCVSITPR